MYDITKENTFESVPRWLKELKDHADSKIVVMLVGNKCDLKNEREVSIQQGTEAATKFGLSFLETSALDATNVDESFKQVLEQIHNITTSNVVHGSIGEQASDPRGEPIKLEPSATSAKNARAAKCC